MPGKVTPVIPEVVTQVAAQVIGNDTAIAIGGMQGHFELNVFIPLMARNLLDSITLLSSSSRMFAEKCIDGIEANREQCETYAELTLSAATASGFILARTILVMGLTAAPATSSKGDANAPIVPPIAKPLPASTAVLAACSGNDAPAGASAAPAP